jgi:hypothetical protein
MQTKWDFAGSTDMWSTSAGGHLMKVVNLTGFTLYIIIIIIIIIICLIQVQLDVRCILYFFHR